MTEIKNEIEAAYPGIFVHAIRIGATDNADRLASFYDSLNRQVIRSTHSVLIVKVDEICQQLSSIEELKDGFDAVGFSQGGQILRAYVQRCNIPRVRNLITIGAQHQGVMDLPGCQSDAPVSDEGDSDFALVQVLMPDILAKDGDCGWWQRMVKKNIYSDLVQGRIVQAQYFKDPHRFEEYLQKNSFLTDINNERGEKNGTYAENIGKLENFVMFMFTKDQQVVPKESAVN
jgi:palmitoyl-protein thioesterase